MALVSLPGVCNQIETECCPDWTLLTSGLQQRSAELAWATLRVLSGGRVGNCPVVMRPCLQAPCNECATSWLNPVLRGGVWINEVCGRSHTCSCEPLCEIIFPGPVARINAVRIDGDVLDPSQYRIDNTNRLVRVDGGCWPSCQYLDRRVGAVGTMAVEYVPGVPVTPMGHAAAGTLACEFSKACSGGKCRLPVSVTSIARQGISFDVALDMFAGGQTGLREVDAYIFSINPNGHRTPPMVWSPDVPWVGHRYSTQA